MDRRVWVWYLGRPTARNEQMKRPRLILSTELPSKFETDERAQAMTKKGKGYIQIWT